MPGVNPVAPKDTRRVFADDDGVIRVPELVRLHQQVGRRWRGPPNAGAQLRVNVVFDEGRIERSKVNQDFHDAGDPGSLDKRVVGLLSGRRVFVHEGCEDPSLVVGEVGYDAILVETHVPHHELFPMSDLCRLRLLDINA